MVSAPESDDREQRWRVCDICASKLKTRISRIMCRCPFVGEVVVLRELSWRYGYGLTTTLPWNSNRTCERLYFQIRHVLDLVGNRSVERSYLVKTRGINPEVLLRGTKDSGPYPAILSQSFLRATQSSFILRPCHVLQLPGHFFVQHYVLRGPFPTSSSFAFACILLGWAFARHLPVQ